MEGILERRLSPLPETKLRAMPELTIGEARRAIGILKRLEKGQAAIAAASRTAVGTPSSHTLAEIRAAARRAAARSA